MGPSAPGSQPPRARREPPRFRPVTVGRVERLSPRMVRVTLAGADIEGLTAEHPAASARLLLPSTGTHSVIAPVWNGNEFLLPDGQRPTIRTFTPRRFDPEALELDLEIVIHGDGVASEWAAAAEPGRPAAVAGFGRGYAIDHEAPAFLLAGDETALPAISQLLESLPHDAAVEVHIEIAGADARLPLPAHPRGTVEWCDLPPGDAPGAALLTAIRSAAVPPDARVWVAGEAAGVQRVRRHLFEERGVPRRQASIRGYWKHGQRG